MRAILIALLVLPLAAAQVPGIEDAITDGVPFELDAPETLARMEAIAASISGQNVHDCVERITMDVPFSYRLMGTPTQSAFVSQYENIFADLGLPSGLQEFSEGGAAFGVGAAALGAGGTNIVAALPGKDPSKWIVMGGHYDTREATIGALDNTSGMCSVYEIARAMKADTDANGPYEASVIFNWYDGEEWGLFGAIAFANDHSVAKGLLGLDADAPVDILVSQSYDMPGINYPAKNIWVQYPENTDPTVNTEKLAVLNLRTAPIHQENEWTCWSYGCYEELKQRPDFDAILRNNTNFQFLMREVAYDFMGAPPDLVWISDDHYGRSDHIPLIAMGAAGNRIQGSHDEEYPCYHQPCDTLTWLYQQVGGQDLLVAAYDMETTIGGTTAAYVALFGDHGQYGDKLWFNDAVTMRDGSAEASTAGPDDQDAPGFTVLLLLAGLVVAFALKR